MNRDRKLYILGVGHSTPLTIELAQDCGYEMAGLYHFQEGRTGMLDYGIPIVGTHEELFRLDSLKGKQFALSMGNNEVRQSLAEKILSMGGALPNLIHPSAHVARSCELGVGVCVDSYAVLQPNTKIGNNTILRHHVLICHNSQVGNHSFIAAHTIVGAYLTLEDNLFMGLGSIAISDKVHSIGHHAVIGAGAVLTKPVVPYAVMAGNPAKCLRSLAIH